MYKDEVQKRNEEKLQQKFDEENISEFIRKYFVNLESKKSCKNYWGAIKQMLQWMIDHKIIEKNSVSEITPEDFYNIESEDLTVYLRERENNGISPTTLNTEKNMFSSFWEYLVRSKKCPVDYNIVKSVKYRGVSYANGLIKKLPTNDQIDAMEEKLAKRKSDIYRIRNLAIFYILKWTGIREGECAGLDLQDLYLDEEIPYIKVLGKGHYREIEKRTVFLTESAVQHIKKWLNYRSAMSNIVDKDAVFLTRDGKRFTENNIRKLFQYNGNGITPHMMRHWYSTFLSTTGNTPFAQQQLGHTSITTTINNYSNGVVGMKDTLKSL